jgi:uncharacterized DUF497 family protein
MSDDEKPGTSHRAINVVTSQMVDDPPWTSRREAGMEFEWDDTKAETNLHEHGVSLPEASTAFADPLAAIFQDPDHSDDELREILVGYSERNRLLVVSFTERGGNIRIISARVASAGERRNHEENPMGGRGRE